jgi:outer membrane lipoprotein SlyB
MIEHEVDLGFVGEPTKVDPKLIKGLIASETEDWVPVIAPIGVAEDGQTYNVNADTVAGAVAGGFLGSNIGSGRASNTAGAIGGAMVGSAIASQAQQAMTSRRGIEISVRLDQGGSVAIVQEVNPREQFSVGDRVRIISSGGRSRVSY